MWYILNSKKGFDCFFCIPIPNMRLEAMLIFIDFIICLIYYSFRPSLPESGIPMVFFREIWTDPKWRFPIVGDITRTGKKAKSQEIILPSCFASLLFSRDVEYRSSVLDFSRFSWCLCPLCDVTLYRMLRFGACPIMFLLSLFFYFNWGDGETVI